MHPKKLLWKIFPAQLLLLAVALVATTWFSTKTIEEYSLHESEKSLLAYGSLIKRNVMALLQENRLQELQQMLLLSGRDAGIRLTLVDKTGQVLADSEETPTRMNNHRTRPEISTAFTGEVGTALRFSVTLNSSMLYVAIPLAINSKDTNYVLRSSLSVATLYTTTATIQQKIGLGALIVIIIAIICALYSARRISRPLEELQSWADSFGRSQLGKKQQYTLADSACLEVVSLSGTLMEMSAIIKEKITTISQQKQQLETVFSAMHEGLIVINKVERILHINQAALSFLRYNHGEAEGKLLQECCRSLPLLQLVENSREHGGQEEITLGQGSSEQRVLQITVLPLQIPPGGDLGALIVLNDLTHIRQLETVRRDFVANVSHELRTPITAIRGYVETLLDGALEDQTSSKKFLAIVLRQTNRLNEIIGDLLELSRLEEQCKQNEIPMRLEAHDQLLENARQTCLVEAAERNISLELDAPQDICLPLNAHLFEQAIINLLINAIRHSNDGETVRVVSCKNENQLIITVSDHGDGIEKQHLPRIFERFYRVDKARSRDTGGTGLGLAIVRHIINGHGGEITVSSKIGEGTIFTISLPLPTVKSEVTLPS